MPGPVHLRYPNDGSPPLPMKPPKQITLKSLRSRVMARDKNICQYCGCALTRGVNKTVDHVLAKARGGLSTMENLVACCTDCNVDKGDKTLDEWTPPHQAIIHRVSKKAS